MVGKQLQRQHRQQRGDFGRGIGDDDDVAGVGAQARVVLADGDGARAAAGDFVQPADDNVFISLATKSRADAVRPNRGR
jgi:hypothetical protein